MEEFIAHGYYTVSNTGGFEIMISKCGEMARVRDAFGADTPETTDWLPIEYNTEGDPVIDPNGLDIPLNEVIRTNR